MSQNGLKLWHPRTMTQIVVDILKKKIFSIFEVPKILINDGGINICNKFLAKLLAKYNVKHKVATPYHP